MVTMGNFSTKFVLQTKAGITQLRGSVHMVGSFKIIPTFHPAAAIYDRSKIGAIEQDFDLLKTLLDADSERMRDTV
jgi:uracil-DNA glycosylase family 4